MTVPTFAMRCPKHLRAAGALFLAISLGQYHIVTGVRSLLDHERLIGWGGEKHSQTDDTCHVMRNTELAGDVVLWGATNKVDTADPASTVATILARHASPVLVPLTIPSDTGGPYIKKLPGERWLKWKN